MRTLWTLHRRLFVLAVVGVLAISTAVVLVASHRGDHAVDEGTGHPSAAGNHRSETARATTAPTTGRTSAAIGQASAGPMERRIDGELAQAETPASIAAARRTGVPAPAVSTAYPAVAAGDRRDPAAYAAAFVTEILDTDFATQSRGSLLAWAEYEEAPNSLPGVPASVANKALVLSLADPDLPGGSPSPLPSAAQWASDAQQGSSQRVTDVQVEVDPDWTEIVSEGWEPTDPRMIVETVTGTLTVATDGLTDPPESFTLTVTLGSAAHAGSGYGAVAISDWTLG